MIGILFATHVEAAPFLEEIQKRFPTINDGPNIFRFRRRDEETAAAVIGMGKIPATQGTIRFIKTYRPNRVLNAGIAGALCDSLQVGEIYVVKEAVDWPDAPNKVESCNMAGFEDLPPVRLVTSDRPVFDNELRAKLRDFGDIVDMEGSKIAAICRTEGIPCTEIKCISDFAADGDRAKLRQNIRTASQRLAQRLASFLITSLLVALVGCGEETPKTGPQAAAPVPSTDKKTEEKASTALPASAPSPRNEGNFEISRREEPYEIFVDIHAPGKDAPGLDWRPKSKQLFVRWGRNSAETDPAVRLRDMLAALYQQEGEPLRAAAVHVPLDWVSYPAFVERLARFAASDPVWVKPSVKASGRGVGVDLRLHGYIVQTASAQPLMPELDTVFEALQTTLRLKYVEKCSTGRFGTRSDIGKLLSAWKIKARSALPAGCLMSWFAQETTPNPEQ